MSCIRFVSKFGRSSMRSMTANKLQHQSLNRRFATLSVQVMEPEQVYAELSKGSGVLVDLRAAKEGVTLKDSVSFPFESIIGSDLGVEDTVGTFSREDNIKALDEKVLGVDLYHQAGQSALAIVRLMSGEPSMSLSKAKTFVETYVNSLEDPTVFVKSVAPSVEKTMKAQVAEIKRQFSSGKPSTAAFNEVESLRADFARYLNLKPKSRSRFEKAPTGAALEDERFADGFLAKLRTIYGPTAPHETVHAELKKRITSAQLKDAKSFVEGPFVDFRNAYDAARLKYYTTKLSKPDVLEGEQSDLVAHSREVWRDFLRYNEKPSKADLARSFSDADLARLAGRQFGNLSGQAERANASAKEALKSLPADRPLFLACNTSYYSTRVANALHAAGAGDVRVVAGGLDRWVVRGVPVELADNLKAQLEGSLSDKLGDKRQAIGDINEMS